MSEISHASVLVPAQCSPVDARGWSGREPLTGPPGASRAPAAPVAPVGTKAKASTEELECAWRWLLSR